MTSRLKNLWQRYLAWRNADVAPPAEPERAVKKIAADDGDAIAHIHAGRGAGWTSGT
ncbi:MAG: hypothetical protein AAF567_10955 [Actinomycetota bacterium]